MSAEWPEALAWQQRQWQSLRRSQGNGRLSHGLLLQGPANTGKAQFARRVAALLLCRAPEEQGGCGHCQTCQLFRAGSHPDFYAVAPEEAGRPIKVDAIRQVGGFLQQTAQFGGARVVIIEQAERMNESAANSLLKTLEEPPANCLLLLVTARPATLLATIRSRCQSLAFPLPETNAVLPWLQARCQDSDAALLLALADGAPLAATSLAATGASRYRQLWEAVEALHSGRQDPLTVADLWQQGDLDRELGWLAAWYSDMIRLSLTASPPRLQHPHHRQALTRLAASLGEQRLFTLYDAVRELHRLRDTQVNMAMQLQGFFALAAS